MVELKLLFADEKGKKCPKCGLKNNIKNTLCWFCDTAFPSRKNKAKEVSNVSP